MDSVALAWMYRPSLSYTIDYGQLGAEGEIRAASAVTEELGLRHRVLRLDCSGLGSGLLSTRPPLNIAPGPEWWPFRNQLLITLASIDAVSVSIAEIWLGTVKSDARNADGTTQFIRAMHDVLQIQEGNLSLSAPAIGLSSVDLIRQSEIPKEVLAYSHSCHTGNYACGECPGCLKHFGVTAQLYGDAHAY
jgi:7-cyano-7-deazaguanine synthase